MTWARRRLRSRARPAVTTSHRRRPSHDIGVGSSGPRPHRRVDLAARVLRVLAWPVPRPPGPVRCAPSGSDRPPPHGPPVGGRRPGSRPRRPRSAPVHVTARCGAGDDRRLPWCCDVEVRRLLHRAHHQRHGVVLKPWCVDRAIQREHHRHVVGYRAGPGAHHLLPAAASGDEDDVRVVALGHHDVEPTEPRARDWVFWIKP